MEFSMGFNGFVIGILWNLMGLNEINRGFMMFSGDSEGFTHHKNGIKWNYVDIDLAKPVTMGQH